MWRPYLISIATAIVLGSTASAAEYHVKPTGDDAGPGSSAKPWRTLNKAFESAGPGDRVLIHDGLYQPDAPLPLKASGAEGKWLVIEAARGAKPVVDGSKAKPENIRAAHDRGLIEIIGPSYVRLKGLAIRNSHFFGLCVRGPSHHIDIQDCTVSRTFGPAIGVWNAKSIRVAGNDVSYANIQEMRLFGDRARECPHEAISIAGVDGFEVLWNHVHDTEKEGIDVKEISRNGTVHHNYVHNLKRQALYVDAWFGTLENVELYSNVAHDAEWGFVISVEGRDSLLRNLKFHHNLLYKNRASGIYFGTWGVDGPRSNIVLEYNTLLDNGRPVHWAGPTGNIDIRSKSTQSLTLRKNLLQGGGAFEIASFIPAAEAPLRTKALGIVSEGNVIEAFKSIVDAPAQYGKPHPWEGFGDVVGRIVWAKPFRPKDANLDIGAFPQGAQTLPKPGPAISGFPPYRPRWKDWPDVFGL